MRYRQALLSALALLVCTHAAAGELPAIALRFGSHTLTAEVAHTEQARAKGLMHRRHLADGAGMLFVFPRTEIMAMWMRNTHIPLSVAFVDEQGVIINIADMRPLSEEIHPAAAPGRYAIEVNRGWFARNGIGPGMRVDGLEQAPAAR